jgi:trimeric autotransporter adhesin
MLNRGVLCLLLAVAALTTACSDDDGTGPEGGARLRVVHADAELPEVDVVVDDIEMASDLTYLTASEYLELEAGPRHVAFVTDDGPVDDFQLILAEGADYTVICCAGFEGSLFLTDDNTESAEGNARVRVIHFATAPAVDVYLTAPDADLEAETPRLVAIGSSDASDYIEVSADDYQIRATTAGTKTVLIDGGIVSLAPGQVRTAIAVDAEGGGEPFSFLVLEDAN